MYYPFRLSFFDLFTLKTDWINTPFGQRHVSEKAFHSNMIAKTKIGMLITIMAALDIHGHVTSLKNACIVFTQIFPQVWQHVKNEKRVCLLRMHNYQKYHISSSYLVLCHKSHQDITPSGISSCIMQCPNYLHMWYNIFDISILSWLSSYGILS